MDITNIQLALIGIVLMVGLTLLWLAVQRIEARLIAVANEVAKLEESMIENTGGGAIENAEMAAAAALHDMKLFGDEDFMIFAPHTNANNSNVQITELEPQDDGEAEGETETETEGNHYSKSKLAKMSVEALREVLEDRGLPSDGTKKLLIQRILAVQD